MARRKETVQQMAGFFDFLDPRKKGSIFDAFGKAPENEESETLHALPAPKTKLPSIRRQQDQSLIPVQKKESLKKRLLSILDVLGPPIEAEEVVQEEEAAVPRDLVDRGPAWEAMFQPSVESQPIFERAKEPLPKYKFITPEVPTIPYGSKEWQFPTIQDMVDHLSGKVDLEKVFDDLSETRGSAAYQDMLADAAFNGIPLYTPISIIDDKNFFTDFADFYAVPWSVIENFRSPEDLYSKVLSPLSLILTEAFEVVKPEYLPGFFTVDYNGQDGHYWLYYVEPWLGRLPGP